MHKTTALRAVILRLLWLLFSSFAGMPLGEEYGSGCDAERRQGVALFAAHDSQEFGAGDLLVNTTTDEFLKQVVEHCAVSEALLGLVAAVAEECQHRRAAHAIPVQVHNGFAFSGMVVGRLQARAEADRISLLDILL
jgi:hypothetical protein